MKIERGLLAVVGAFLLVCGGVTSLPGQTITDFNPKVGTTNDSIVITGTGFLPSSGLHVQFWDRKSATGVVNGDTQLTATVPSGATTGPISIFRSGTTNFTGTSFLVIGRGPYITDFSPTYGRVNDTITINGVHFTNATVKFNGISSTSVVVSADSTMINARVPFGATNGPISVMTSEGSYTNPNPFTVIGPGPTIFGFDPASGPGGSSFTIQGVNFLTGVSSVKVNGTNVASFFVQSDVQILVTNRADVSTGFVTVTGPMGSSTSTNYFYVPPVVSSFSPTNGVANTSVTLTGQNFLGTTNVQFDGVNASFTLPTNNSTLYVQVPTGMVQSARIRVQTPGGVQFSGPNFRMLPVITGFSPGLGRLNTNVVISGANLNEGLSSVKFNGTNASVVGTPAFGQVTVTVPAGAATGPITITTTNGTVSSVTNFFLPPGITSFTPNNSPAGSLVQISGSNFLGATFVTFNGVPISITPPTNNTSIAVTVSNGVTTGPLGVITPFGTFVNTNLLFYALPIISSFTPTHGSPGDGITISGTNFLGTTNVQFNGTTANFTILNNGQINAAVPTNAFNGPISVTAPAGTASSATSFLFDIISDLSVQVTAVPNPVFVGSNLTYTIVVSNAGPYGAANVGMTNSLPASVLLKSATSTSGTLNTNVNPIIGTWATLNSGSSATVTLVVVPQAVGNIVDSVNTASSYTDPVPGNNSSAINTTVYPLPVLSVQIYSPLQVQLSWPAVLTNFVLQSNGSLANSNGWSNVASPPLTSGDQKIVIDSIGAGPTFYRLKF